MRLECDKYQGGQFPNLEGHLSLLLSFFFPMWHFVLSHFSPETVSVYRPFLLFMPFFCSIPSSVLFFCQPLSSGHFLSDLHCLFSHLLPSSPSLPLLFISFHPHTLVFWLLYFGKETRSYSALIRWPILLHPASYEICHLDGWKSRVFG